MTSQSTSAESANVTKTTSSNTGDSCTWYAGENCSQPRTGYDCLNVLLDTDECAIAPNGACVSMSDYEKYLSNREYYEPLARYFPASNYTYCSSNDSVCSNCIAEWTTNYEATGSVGSTKYCTGSDGCVCVAAVEVPSWKQAVISNQCEGSSDSDSMNTSQEFSSTTQICLILGICFGALMLFLVFLVRRWFRSTVSRSSRSSRHHPSGPQLKLTGWKSLREKLIETEHSFVQGETRLDATARSDESLSEVPSITIEVSPAPRRPESLPPAEAQYMMAPM
ncbi:hypothetical protein F441_10819 [Phytophthora nicotianae CJ01A1]|uniref:Uncharacterized protein n=2 Tax=Phytophthora nicotianae TaxID=4792 RepID=W2IWD1_PHYNI|nr:hypothetical protein L915_10630 [Phytophthora nicotianae]ETL37847.1 hypothetical protein L916_10520 [Phytophthora nicotianae]ETL90987.1 hypothetical protein L917_10439 [Phytophthora nicotianae]ETP14229.1 hypothetical protein F441_10819 [Phytophthora nicotianae CJ01A1]